MAELLAIESLRAGYGEAVVLSQVSLSIRRRPGARAARPQRHGQDHADQLDRRRHALSRRHASGSTGATSRGCAPTSAPHAGVGWVPQERNIFKSLTVEENLTAVARPGPWTTGKVYEMFPRLARAASAISATSSPAASSRCSRSAAR